MKSKKPSRVAILFSGGADSTAVAVHLLQEGREALLLTFDNGAEKWLELAGYKADFIRKQFPGLCAWKLLDSTPLFHDLAIAPMVDDVGRYGKGGNLVCCGCKLAMLCEAIVYCRKHGIREIADGFQKAQDFYPEQTPDYMVPADRFARSYGIRYFHPFWDNPGLKQDKITLGGAVPPSPIQPWCLFGCNPILDKKCIRPYVESKLPAMKVYVDSALGMKKRGR
ncbi:MAG: hypothetical protein WCP22_00930 [Chlamydiota bacterium]